MRSAVFKLLHEPPTDHGINRTSWTTALLCKILKENGRSVGTAIVAKMIKAAGYKWRTAKIVLTSNDPTYMEKLTRIRLLELVPAAKSIAYLGNPSNPVFTEGETRELQAAARAHGLRLVIVNAGRPSEFETAFADIVRQKADALVVSSAVSLLTHPDQIVALAAQHALPAIYAWRPSVAVGGLISYATGLPNAWRQAGVYTGRILKGEKPDDLPVLQPTKFELLINLKTAKALGLIVPQTLQVAAEEVIE